MPIYINDSTFLCRRINNDGNKQERYLFLVNGKLEVVPSMETLNKAEIPVRNNGYLHNILSSLVVYNAKRNRVVEASVYIMDGF